LISPYLYQTLPFGQGYHYYKDFNPNLFDQVPLGQYFHTIIEISYYLYVPELQIIGLIVA